MGQGENQPLLGEDAPKSFSQKLKGLATPATIRMAVYTVLYVVSGVVNSIFLKKLMNSLANYSFFLNQVTNYSYIPIFGAVVLWELKFTKLITKEQRDFPWWKFFIMGALDALNGYIVVIGGVNTSGTMQQLLNQAIIPVTMIGSFIFLKERYSLIQLGGALLIVGGVMISLWPSLTGGGDKGNVPFFNMFFLTQAIPFAASNLYKDIAFKSVDMDVWYLQFWDVAYQSVIGTLLFPVNTILPGNANISWKEIPSSMENGGRCLAGFNVVTVHNHPNCLAPGAEIPCDNCEHAWLTLIIYMTINVSYNVFILLVIKHGSATVLSIAQTVRLPLTSIAFSQKWIMGSQSEPFANYTIYGLFIILAGLTSFRAGSLMKKSDNGSEETKIIPRLGPGGTEIFAEAVRSTPLILPKTTLQHRQLYFSRLGIVQ